VLELHIPEDAQPKAKIQKLVSGAHEAKAEVVRVQFELNMRIMELQLKSQPSTPPKVKGQHRAAIKEGMATVDDTVVDCTAFFK